MLDTFDAFIGYTPINDEPDPSLFLKAEGLPSDITRLPQERDTDPFAVAHALLLANVGKKVCLLIPGQRFDEKGTRHGRGGGWYDRFLSAVPREWLRVGVLNPHQFSKKELTREEWDEPMDALLIKETSAWKFFLIKN